MIHLKVSAKIDTQWAWITRKARWLMLALLAPEPVMLSASGQWAFPQRSVADMKAPRYTNGTLAHAFYSDSEGFGLETPDIVTFPVAAEQFRHMVTQRYLPMLNITEEIWEKSGADEFAEAVASFRAALACGSRHCLRPPETTLETPRTFDYSSDSVYDSVYGGPTPSFVSESL